MNHTLSDSQLEEMIKSAVNSSGPLPPDEKFSQLISALRELQERRKADSEPVAWTWQYREQWHVTSDPRRAEYVAKDGDVAVLPLYRHAQQPVVPDAAAVYAQLSDHEKWSTSLENVNHVLNAFRAAMLAAAPQEVK